METLAIHGGKPVISEAIPEALFAWPIVTREDEEAVVDVLRKGLMSGNAITKEFEAQYAAWNGRALALAYPNGTEALRAALWACGVGAGDEIICPSMTYWASATAALGLGAAVNFADIEAKTLCIDPQDIERRIGPKTKVIVVVHYAGYPCDMDAIMAMARRHKVKVLEDVSHAHGTLYKGKMAGTFGDVAAMSMMTGKAFPVGEGGMLVTDDRALYERCIAYGFYERTGVPSRWNATDAQVTIEELTPYAGIPLGGFKHRMNQMAAAMGLVQLKHYPERIREIQSAMNRFWDLLEGVPGLTPHRPPKDSGSTMGGWYTARGLYDGAALGGVSCAAFCEAVRAEGFAQAYPGANRPLHLHPVFHTADLFRMGSPTMVSFGQRDVRQGPGTLPVTERIDDIAFGIPWFKKDDATWITRFADIFRKVAENAHELK